MKYIYKRKVFLILFLVIFTQTFGSIGSPLAEQDNFSLSEMWPVFIVAGISFLIVIVGFASYVRNRIRNDQFR